MRLLLWIVAVLALASALDSSLYDGRNTRAVAQLTRAIAVHFR